MVHGEARISGFPACQGWHQQIYLADLEAGVWSFLIATRTTRRLAPLKIENIGRS
jgi:hypothetical protein